MAAHHIIPRFYLKRWANETGFLEVVDRQALTVSEEEPARFYALSDFNRMEDSQGLSDPWLEHAFLGSLDSDVADLMRQLENVPNPLSLIKLKKNRDWHALHLMSPRNSVRLAMYVGAQAVRSPAWRNAVNADTAVDVNRTLEEKVQADLEKATDPAEVERLQQMLGLRYWVQIEGNTVPHLSGHLAYRLGHALYEQFAWSIWRFPEPVLMLGNDPVLLLGDSRQNTGFFSQVASRAWHKLSAWRELSKTADDAVEVLGQTKSVVLPLDPVRALVLRSFRDDLPPLPGSYEMPLTAARPLNALMSLASPHWLALPPGHLEEARQQLFKRYPFLERQHSAAQSQDHPDNETPSQ